MNRKTLSTLVSTLLIVGGTTPVFAASNTAQISSSQAVNVTQPKVKLDDKTINAISNPKLPSVARIPEKKIKPKHVPVIDQLQPSRPSDRGKLSGVAHQPRVEASTPVTIEKPQLETNFQSNRIKQIQEAINTARLLDHIEDIPGAGEMPGRVADDPLADTAIGGHRPEVGEGLDVHGIVRELLLGRGGTFDDAQIGRSDGGGFDAMKYGIGATPGTELVNDGGVASAGHTKDSHVEDWLDFGSSDDGRSRSGSNWYANGSNVHWFQNATSEGTAWSEFHRDSNGNLYMVVKGFDEGSNGEVDPGDTRLETVRDEDGTVRERECQGGECGEWVDITPDEDSQPNETASNKYSDCNPVTGWGCMKKGDGDPQSIWDRLTQPSTGEDGNTGPGSGAPSVGAVAVTNPDEFHQTGGSGGSGNTQPYDPRDPEEGIEPHESGPVRPGPSGPSTVATAEILDEAMGVATFE